MQDEITKGSRHTAMWINHDLTRKNELAFSSATNLQLYHFLNIEIVLFLFQLMYMQRIGMNDMLWKSNDESSRQDQTQLHSASESRKIVLSSQFLFGCLQCCEL